MGRFFAHGDLRFLILHLISQKPRHGYEIIKAIEDDVAGHYSPSPGVVYPTLILLEELDWAQVVASDGSKKLYEATQNGALALTANRTIVESILARMAEVRKSGVPERRGGRRLERAGLPPRLRRAFGKLTDAMAAQLSDRPVPRGRVAAIEAALVAATESVKQA